MQPVGPICLRLQLLLHEPAVNLRSFNSVFIGIIRSHLLTLSNVGVPNWSWIPRHHIQVQEEK